jgi:hypothetical protein
MALWPTWGVNLKWFLCKKSKGVKPGGVTKLLQIHSGEVKTPPGSGSFQRGQNSSRFIPEKSKLPQVHSIGVKTPPGSFQRSQNSSIFIPEESKLLQVHGEGVNTPPCSFRRSENSSRFIPKLLQISRGLKTPPDSFQNSSRFPEE